MNVRLSVVIGTYDRIDSLKECLRAIREGSPTPPRVHVTDAGSTDGTVDYLRSIASDTIVPIFEGERVGQAKALNRVFGTIDTEYVCWLSDDNVVLPGALDIAVGILEDRPRIGMVGLKVRDMLGPFTAAPYIGGLSSLGILNVNQGVLRTEILKSVGGFSEEYRDYGIDPDLTAKVLFAGWQVVYTRDVAILHHREWSTRTDTPEYRARMERQRGSLEVYERKFADRKRSPGLYRWFLKRAFWTWLQRALTRLRLAHPEGKLLGIATRDLMNAFCGRFISVLDPIKYRRERYHLVQIPPAPNPLALVSRSAGRDLGSAVLDARGGRR